MLIRFAPPPPPPPNNFHLPTPLVIMGKPKDYDKMIVTPNKGGARVKLGASETMLMLRLLYGKQILITPFVSFSLASCQLPRNI